MNTFFARAQHPDPEPVNDENSVVIVVDDDYEKH